MIFSFTMHRGSRLAQRGSVAVIFTSESAKRAFLHKLGAHQAATALAADPSALVEPRISSVDQKLRDLVTAIKLDPLTFYEAIPLNVDLIQIRDRWFLWLLREELKPHDKKGHCEAVAKLYERKLNGDAPTKKEWKDAADAAAAASAAYAAAYAANAAADAAAAYVAANAAAASTADAAYAARSQKREECYVRMRTALLKLVQGETL